jgi:hypothetical protein
VTDARQWVYLVVSAAPPVLRIEELVTALGAAGWSICVIATPTAASWIDLDALAARTGCLTAVHARSPRQQESLPRADAVAAAPITFNSINKWAAGTSDTFALSVLNEMLGTDVPIVAAPCVKAVLRTHPRIRREHRPANARRSVRDGPRHSDGAGRGRAGNVRLAADPVDAG